MIGKRAKLGAWGDPPNFVAPVNSSVLGECCLALRDALWNSITWTAGLWDYLALAHLKRRLFAGETARNFYKLCSTSPYVCVLVCVCVSPC